MSFFELPELDKRKTKEAVEDALYKYRMYKYLDFEDKETNVTSSLKDIVVATSGTSDQTASAAIFNADAKAYQKRYCDRVEKAVRRLPPQEKFLIEKRYMSHDADYMTDIKMYTKVFQPDIPIQRYYKLRWMAFYRLALALELNVTKTEEDDLNG